MTLTVFDREITVRNEPRTFRHDQRFLTLIGVDELQHTFFRRVELPEMRELAAALGKRVHTGTAIDNPVWVFVFAHGPGSDRSISAETTHALSVFSPATEGLRLQHFERAGETLREVPALSMTTRAVPDLDDIRLLHFSHFEIGRLPRRSIIWEFKAVTWGVEDVLHRRDPRLREAVLLDAGKIGGAPAIGLYGDQIYATLLKDQGQGTGGHCGNDDACPIGEQGCVPVPPRDSAGYTCGEADGGDGWIGVVNAALKLELLAAENAELDLVRRFITEFLPRYPRGRQYVALYYAGSRSLRRDRRAIEQYVEVLPELGSALRQLLHGDDDSVVLSTELRDAMLRTIALHRRVRRPPFFWRFRRDLALRPDSRVFERILDVVEDDVRAFGGMRRSDLLRALERERAVDVRAD
jgi:hypothetical protein